MKTAEIGRVGIRQQCIRWGCSLLRSLLGSGFPGTRFGRTRSISTPSSPAANTGSRNMLYQSIAVIASQIETTEEELFDLQSRGWISTVEKNGIIFIPGRNEYKARFILHLRHKLRLTDEEIIRVLAAGAPPYPLKDIPGILRRSVP